MVAASRVRTTALSLRRFSGATVAAVVAFVVILLSSHFRSSQQNN